MGRHSERTRDEWRTLGGGNINKALHSSKDTNWCTPQKFFDELNEEFHFTLDVAANEKSAKCEKYYSPEDDGLSAPWLGVVFCSPPYGREIGKWVKKAHDEWQEHNTTVVMLIPSRTDTKYFHEYILGKAEIRFIKGRLKFTDEDGVEADAAPFPSMVAIFRGGRII